MINPNLPKSSPSALSQIRQASLSLDSWIESHGFQGWDPFDALNSPFLKRLAFGNRRLGQLWVQLFKRNPLNLRPLFSVPQGYNPKAMGLFLASYLRKYLLTGSPEQLERVHFFFDWLEAHISPGWQGAGWGYNFDWPNRSFFAPAGTPNIVTTAFIGLACLDLSELPDRSNKSTKSGRSIRSTKFELSDLSDMSDLSDFSDLSARSFRLARLASEFILSSLHRFTPAPDENAFSYTPLDQCYVYNASLLGAWLLARLAVRTEERELKNPALASALYTVRRQRPDGTWPYGEDPSNSWADNFHTGYVLVALQEISNLLHTDGFVDAIQKGYNTWKVHFFTRGYAPRYYSNYTYPLDVHSAAQAILTFLEFSKIDPEALQCAYQVARWVIENMQDRAGFFQYQVWPLYRNQIPYMRWSQAWMQRALTELAWREAHEDLD